VTRIRTVGIRNFRGIAALDWVPMSGVNCFIGPGDGGKSTVLDAIDLCLGARRNAQFNDADFHALDTGNPISIRVTLGDLPAALRGMETFGLLVRGFDGGTGIVEDEPGAGLETVLTLSLTVAADLEPVWSLLSDRTAEEPSRNLPWAERVRLSPTRLGGSGDANLGWRRGSVLSRLSDETPVATAALVKASRDAREAFGDQAEEQLAETLALVARVAASLVCHWKGVPAPS